MPDYQKTKVACYLGFVTQAISANFAPLLFLKFHNDYDISLGNIALISTFFFFTQLFSRLILCEVCRSNRLSCMYRNFWNMRCCRISWTCISSWSVTESFYRNYYKCNYLCCGEWIDRSSLQSYHRSMPV